MAGLWLSMMIGNLIPTDELHHFSEGLVETTNQMMFGEFKSLIYTKLGIQLAEIGIHHYQQGGLTPKKTGDIGTNESMDGWWVFRLISWKLQTLQSYFATTCYNRRNNMFFNVIFGGNERCTVWNFHEFSDFKIMVVGICWNDDPHWSYMSFRESLKPPRIIKDIYIYIYMYNYLYIQYIYIYISQ